MLVSPQEVLDAQRYDSDELPFVTTLILGAEAFLRNAGAYREQNDLTPAVIHLIVGFGWITATPTIQNMSRLVTFL